MLAGLGHRAVGRRNDQNGPVHLGGARDHVLDVVSVPGAIDVRIVPLFALVLDVGDGDRHGLGRVANGAPLGDVCIRLRLRLAMLGQDRQEGGREGRLTVVNVPDRAHVDVRLGSGESFLGHRYSRRLLETEGELEGLPGKIVMRLAVPATDRPRTAGKATAAPTDRPLMQGRKNPKLPLGFEPRTSSLPRTRSTN